MMEEKTDEKSVWLLVFPQMAPIAGQQSETVANAHSNHAFVTNPGL